MTVPARLVLQTQSTPVLIVLKIGSFKKENAWIPALRATRPIVIDNVPPAQPTLTAKPAMVHWPTSVTLANQATTSLLLEHVLLIAQALRELRMIVAALPLVPMDIINLQQTGA